MEPATQAALSLLDSALSAPDAQAFGEALKTHGPISAEEVPYLDEKSKSPAELVRRNAARLLATTVKGDALNVLRRRIADTPDPQVFIIALRGLLREPDAKRLASARPELLAAALNDPDPRVLGVALRGAALAGLPNLEALLAGALKSPDQEVRGAALEVIAQVGLGSLEPLVKDALLHARKRAPYPFLEMYRMLSRSDDPDMAAVFRQSLQQTEEVSAFFNGITESRKPWLRGLLLGMMRQDGPMRWNAFRALTSFRPDGERELVSFCAELLEKTPTGDALERRRYLFDLEACRDYLGELAGRTFAWDERDAMLAFARTRLHP